MLSGRRISGKLGRCGAIAEGEESWEVRVRGYYPREICENIVANLCNLVHFGGIRSSNVGRKIDAFRLTFRSGTEFTVPAV